MGRRFVAIQSMARLANHLVGIEAGAIEATEWLEIGCLHPRLKDHVAALGVFVTTHERVESQLAQLIFTSPPLDTGILNRLLAGSWNWTRSL